MNLNDKNIAVLGYGTEGKAVIDYLRRQGIKPTIFDIRDFSSLNQAEQNELKNLGLNFVFGANYLEELVGFDLAFRSPGIWRKAPGLLKAEKNGTIISSQTKWFFENCPSTIIGVTGTKGKGTTSTLIYEFLQKSKFNGDYLGHYISNTTKIHLTGNIGKTNPLDILDSLTKVDLVVFELSSFQLQDLKTSPHIGVVLMVTSDHLDIHEDIKEYHLAKQAVVKYQESNDFAVINSDYSASVDIGSLGNGRKLFFSRKNELGIDSCYVKNNQIILNYSGNIETFNKTDITIRGEHNLENICASILVASILGVGKNSINEIIKEFKGLDHRLQLVAENDGILFYDDSFSTNEETAIAAIKAFTEPLILIVGGYDKKLEYEHLAKIIVAAGNIKKLIVIGQTTDKIIKSLREEDYKGEVVTGAKNMEEIFKQISDSATPGDIVLLSPACASFDMFKNYNERGLEFSMLAKKWRRT